MDFFSPGLVLTHPDPAADAETPRPRSADVGYRVEVVSDYEALVRLQPVWNALIREANITHPFLSHEWVCSWWECFAAAKQLHVVVVKDEGKVVGIAPLMRSVERMYGLHVRRVGLIYNPHSPRLDFIVAPGATGVYQSVWRHLLDIAREWDVLELSQVPADSATLTTLSRFAVAEGYRFGVWHGEDSPVVPFSGGWDDYVKQLSRNHRAKVRKGFNRLSRCGEVRLEVVSEYDQLTAALEDGLRIEAAAWKNETGTAIRSQAEIERFYRDFGERAAKAGWLRLLFLNVGGERVAFAYALLHGNKLYVLKAGYDPVYSYFSPYNLLCNLVFKDGFERGLEAYEFLGNNDAWKLDWTQQVRPHHWLYVFAPGLRARLLYHIKFRWIPVLRRQRLFRFLHETFFGPTRVVRPRAFRHWFWPMRRPAHREADVNGDSHADG